MAAAPADGDRSPCNPPQTDRESRVLFWPQGRCHPQEMDHGSREGTVVGGTFPTFSKVALRLESSNT
jgi:hypothetical protein